MAVAVKTRNSPFAQFVPLPIEDVRLEGGFWGPKVEINRTRALPHQYAECVRTGRIDNFHRAAGRKECDLSKHLAPDSDVYKWMEAVAYSLAAHPDPQLEETLDALIELVAAAQDANGYLHTEFIGEKAAERWKDLPRKHEMYCGGHLLQAAVAHHRVTGKRTFLDVAVKWAEHVWKRFGAEDAEGAGGHPEVEPALVELWRETDDRRWLDLARRLIDRRGTPASKLNGRIELQDHLPVRQQRTPTGHAVRQLYLLCGLADLYAETGEAALLRVLEEQWLNFTRKKTTVTGGAGARYAGEVFGTDYELPNRTGYNETCAAVASFMWNWRMLLITGAPRYAEEMERVLYNGFLAGVSLEGTEYFYTNPLEHDGGASLARDSGSARRTTRHWDQTPCCPPNAARLLASLTCCLCGVSRDGRVLRIHHYAAGTVRADTAAGEVRLRQETNYPWDGRVSVLLEGAADAEWTLALRVPGWAREATVTVNNENAREAASGTYVEIARRWRAGDRVVLDLPLPVRKLCAHPRVTDCVGCVALVRGPVVYCLEGCDYPGLDLFGLSLPLNANLKPRFDPIRLAGVTVLEGTAEYREPGTELYTNAEIPPARNVPLTAIPYFAWANREKGAMRVWIPTH
jgi:hypothetical protein